MCIEWECSQEKDFQTAPTSPIWREEITVPYVNSGYITPVSAILNEGMGPEREFSVVNTQKNKRDGCLSRCYFSVPPFKLKINSRCK